jgi:hypothetical protein
VLPEVSVPKEAAVAKRLVDEAVVAKALVDVACDVVALAAVTFWRVAAPLAVRVLKVAPLVALNCDPIVVEPVVTSVLREESEETLSEVEVALVVVPLITERRDIEEEALTMMPTVVVGVSAPLMSSKVLPNGEEPAVA